ncbi:MAG: hypothetical protein ACKVOJ_00290 [Sphingomonadaceae bacterium]
MKHALVLIAAALPTLASAQNAVTIKSDIFVARTVTDAQGNKKNTLVAPTRVLPGEPLAIIINYANTGTKPATNFVIDNPVPKAVTFTGVAEAWAVVSVDDGKTFGPLTTLKIKNPDGTVRAAQPSDVVAVRWTLAKPIVPGGTGKVMFYGVVK